LPKEDLEMKNWLRLVVSIILPLVVGAVAGMFTASEINGWFQTINKPTWQPPNWVFGPVWTVLYVMMGVAFFLIWNKEAPKTTKRLAMTLWIIQLVFNFLWSFIFFKKHQLDWALGEILVLWFFILLTILFFARISKLAAWLMVPYISWVTFASLLTFFIYDLNTASSLPSGGGGGIEGTTFRFDCLLLNDAKTTNTTWLQKKATGHTRALPPVIVGRT
jgi:tryptophan-rich sensory protein